ncbi:hypothetical protein jhhlp_002695 [Lomentospora prolificans]|uniref:Uncharacterized protein n=1 Tax=Lomentospora prolificans TaxID=41688 RepID=A0A2N3NEX0_9PEZI|nr:hypothetical protein jhhlp_002695 [Lomentospora prolificans]
MGNDGGSIPTRRELVKNAARNPTISELRATAHESLSHAWSHCPLTGDKLDMENTVSDWCGRLYNYESVLKALMPVDDDDAKDEEIGAGEVSFASTGIKSLRDIVKVKFKRYTPPEGKAKWACPISLKEFGAGTKALYIVPCGHAFSEVAMKEVQEKTCPECGESFEETNVIPILPTTEAETKKLAERIEKLQEEGLAHSLKKDKKAGKKKRKRGDAEKTEANGNNGEKNGERLHKAAKKDDRLSGINNAMASSLTAKVLAEQDELNRRRKLAGILVQNISRFASHAIYLQLVFLAALGRSRSLGLTSRRSTNLHLVHTLLRFRYAPELLFLGTGEPDVCAPPGTVPAALTILIPQDHALTSTKAFAVETVFVIGEFAIDAVEVAHAGVSVALLALLHGLLKPAELIRVLARLGANAFVLEGSKDIIRSVVFGKVLLFSLKSGDLGGEVSIGGVEGITRCGNGRSFERLTDISVLGLILGGLEVLPVDTVHLTILEENIANLGIANEWARLSGNLGSIVLPRLNSLFDTLVVEVGIVLVLEARQDTLKVSDLSAKLIALVDNKLESIAELLNTHLGLLKKLAELTATDTSLDNLSAFRALDIVEFLLQLNLLQLSLGNITLEVGDLGLHVPADLLSLTDELEACSASLLHGFAPLLLNAAVFLADLHALVRALDASNTRVFLGTIAAQFVITDAIIDISEGNIAADVTPVLAPKAG